MESPHRDLSLQWSPNGSTTLPSFDRIVTEFQLDELSTFNFCVGPSLQALPPPSPNCVVSSGISKDSPTRFGKLATSLGISRTNYVGSSHANGLETGSPGRCLYDSALRPGYPKNHSWSAPVTELWTERGRTGVSASTKPTRATDSSRPTTPISQRSCDKGRWYEALSAMEQSKDAYHTRKNSGAEDSWDLANVTDFGSSDVAPDMSKCSEETAISAGGVTGPSDQISTNYSGNPARPGEPVSGPVPLLTTSLALADTSTLSARNSKPSRSSCNHPLASIGPHHLNRTSSKRGGDFADEKTTRANTTQAKPIRFVQGNPVCAETADSPALPGCWTCKVRRKGCDKRRPFCITCAQLGLDCDGYSKRRPEHIRDPKQRNEYRKFLSSKLALMRAQRKTTEPPAELPCIKSRERYVQQPPATLIVKLSYHKGKSFE